MASIYETKNFIVESFETPHVTRSDGGHLRIIPKLPIVDRTALTPEQAIEFMRLTVVVGEAFKTAMAKQGIELVRVNYQDMGNWAFKKDAQPVFHMHIYGRAKDAKYQHYKEAVQLPDRSTGFYDKFEPLNDQDAALIKEEIEKIFRKEKYDDKNWKL